MAKFDYQCSEGHTFEVEQSVNDKPLKTCKVKKCNAVVRRLIGAPSFVLRGGGWAADGYSGGAKKN